MELTFAQKVLIFIFKGIDRLIPWHKLPGPLAAFNMFAFRTELRAKNLYDTYPSADYQGTTNTEPMEDSKFIAVRNSDGKFNDLSAPRMGCSGMRFGRNVPRECTQKPTPEQLMNPNPRLISERLFKRNTFKPATSINLLAAAWIQFQVHDWAQHTNSKEETYQIGLSSGDNWSDPSMNVFKTVPDAPLDGIDLKCPAYKNENTAWWDGSQIYGSSEARTRELRTSRKHDDGLLSMDTIHGESFLPRLGKIPDTGFSENWWIGLELLHTLFVLEHNAIATMLRTNNPTWTGDQIFGTARLINTALMAKIHTLEWTPSVLAHPAVEAAQQGCWWGVAGEKIGRAFGQLSTSDTVSGILNSGADQMGAPYCLTEEFVAVYRLHPLIPDSVAFFDVHDGYHKSTAKIQDVAFENAISPFDKSVDGAPGLTFADALYSFGINYPGAITHNNTADFLRDLHIPERPGEPARHLDIGAVDILRDRERGIPRYNNFRRHFHMPPVKTFEELTGGDKALAADLKEIYENDIELVDMLVGCHCEPLPKGFGFSDTAFRVFILMAGRRLKSDRFLADDFKPAFYTIEGINWVQNNTMKDVLCRHFPELRAPLRTVKNAFAPWEKIGASADYRGQETNEHPSEPYTNGYAK